jgi:hypothetical protein
LFDHALRQALIQFKDNLLRFLAFGYLTNNLNQIGAFISSQKRAGRFCGKKRSVAAAILPFTAPAAALLDFGNRGLVDPIKPAFVEVKSFGGLLQDFLSRIAKQQGCAVVPVNDTARLKLDNNDRFRNSFVERYQDALIERWRTNSILNCWFVGRHRAFKFAANPDANSIRIQPRSSFNYLGDKSITHRQLITSR